MIASRAQLRCLTAGLLQASREASMGMMECTLTQHQTDAQVCGFAHTMLRHSLLWHASLLLAQRCYP
jgi:hypothetical protein